jgi:hypothetical protein
MKKLKGLFVTKHDMHTNFRINRIHRNCSRIAGAQLMAFWSSYELNSHDWNKIPRIPQIEYIFRLL